MSVSHVMSKVSEVGRNCERCCVYRLLHHVCQRCVCRTFFDSVQINCKYRCRSFRSVSKVGSITGQENFTESDIEGSSQEQPPIPTPPASATTTVNTDAVDLRQHKQRQVNVTNSTPPRKRGCSAKAVLGLRKTVNSRLKRKAPTVRRPESQRQSHILVERERRLAMTGYYDVLRDLLHLDNSVISAKVVIFLFFSNHRLLIVWPFPSLFDHNLGMSMHAHRTDVFVVILGLNFALFPCLQLLDHNLGMSTHTDRFLTILILNFAFSLAVSLANTFICRCAPFGLFPTPQLTLHYLPCNLLCHKLM